MAIWSGHKVAKYIGPPEVKIGPNGVDIKVSEVWKIHPETISIVNGKTRTTSIEKKLIQPDNDGFYNLETGIYEIRTAHEIEIPTNAIGRLHPRSTLNRLGAIKSETALWDSGYKGYGTQTIYIPIKLFKIHKDDFWFQMCFEDCEVSELSYAGHYQGEAPVEQKEQSKKSVLNILKNKIIKRKKSI